MTCKYLKQGLCTNEECLFLGYSETFCKVCTVKAEIKCAFYLTDEVELNCGYYLPDGYVTCNGFNNCRIYKMQIEEENSGRK